MIDSTGSPERVEKDYVLFGMRSAHEFCAKRIRQKLVYGTDDDTLVVEAAQMVRRDIGSFPSEGPDPYSSAEESAALEEQMQKIAARNYVALRETESYMWGLGIAGVFHQWERSTRETIQVLSNESLSADALDKMRFNELCDGVHKTGFGIAQSAGYLQLCVARLISNTIKHGKGPALTQLLAERPEMFRIGSTDRVLNESTVQPEPLHLSVREFDQIVDAIDRIWSDYEDAIIKLARR